MKKTEVISWSDFFPKKEDNVIDNNSSSLTYVGEIRNQPSKRVQNLLLTAGVVATVVGGVLVIFAPETVLANTQIVVNTVETSTSWKDITERAVNISNYLVDAIIIFAGAIWMFGNRTKSIELILGSGIGYLIIRHHELIKGFFAGI